MKTEDYKMSIYKIVTDDGFDWVAEYPAFPGLVGTGDTVDETIDDLKENFKFHIDVMKSSGMEMPEPDVFHNESSYSGRITVRTSRSNHSKIVEIAKRDGISLNQWINNAISYALGKDDMVRNRIFMSEMRENINKLVMMSKRNEKNFNHVFQCYKDKSTENGGYVKPQNNISNMILHGNVAN